MSPDPQSLVPEAPREAGERAPAHPPPSAGSSRSALLVARDTIETVLVAVMVVLFTTTFAVQNSVIPTASMEDTLLIGDYLLVNKVVLAPADAAAPTRWLGQRPLRHGDVVVFKFPNNPAVDYVKRVIGLPGDVLELRDKQLFRNVEAPDEPYKRHKTGITYPRGTPGQDGTRDNLAPVTVPEGHLFVMGDNRDYSADSREWRFVPRTHVTGRAFVVFWSRDRRPGSWSAQGAVRIQQVVASIRTFYRDTRWRRIGTRVR
jgi:signal peptidase I